VPRVMLCHIVLWSDRLKQSITLVLAWKERNRLLQYELRQNNTRVLGCNQAAYR
jgi:hypothetical protein